MNSHHTAALFGITADLYQFMNTLQRPKLLDPKWVERSKLQCDQLSKQALMLRKSAAARQKALSHSLEVVAKSLESYAQALETARGKKELKKELKRELKKHNHALARGYEALRVGVRATHRQYASSQAVPKLARFKGTNYPRNVYHLVNGLVSVFLYEYFLTQKQALVVLLVFSGFAITCESLRKLSPRINDFLLDRVFKVVARPWERHHVNSATYFTIALTLMIWIFPKHAAELGCLVLAVGDPAATVFGKRWGTVKLWREKSFLGTAAFFGFSFFAVWGFLAGWVPQIAGMPAIALAFSVAAVGAVAEVFGTVLDDNFTIPLLCASVASFWI
ncbi:hypothetical protein WDW86_07095 [Bdellovibrionota bacterium FG-2]